MTTDRHGIGSTSLEVLLDGGSLAGLTDVELLERLRTNNSENANRAFEALVTLHGPMVLRVCRSILANSHDAEDAFQATFLIMAQRAHSIRQARSVSSWLHGVAVRVSRSARVAASRRRTHEQRAAATQQTHVPMPPDREAVALFHEELICLPERYRVPLILCDLEGMTHDRAAAQLGWPVGTIKSRLARGRDRLRNRLIRRGLSPDASFVAMLATAGDRAGRLVEMSSISVHDLAAGHYSAQVGSLASKVLLAMTLNKMRLLLGIVLASVLVGFGSRPSGPAPAVAQETATSPVQREVPTSTEFLKDQKEPADPPLIPAVPRPWETVVRIKVTSQPEQREIVASGAIIQSDEKGTLVVTSGHTFLPDDFPETAEPGHQSPKIRVDLFDGQFSSGSVARVKATESFTGELLLMNRKADVALVRFWPGRRLMASPITPLEPPTKIGQSLVSVGCSDGNDALAWSTTVLKTNVGFHDSRLDFKAIECRFEPRRGRSGGGLFNREGELVGVACFADPNNKSGLYSPAGAIRGLLVQANEGINPDVTEGTLSNGSSTPVIAKGVQTDRDLLPGLSRRMDEIEKKLNRILEALETR